MPEFGGGATPRRSFSQDARQRRRGRLQPHRRSHDRRIRRRQIAAESSARCRTIWARCRRQRNSRKNARTSPASSSGCSSAAKCPPFSITLQRRISVNTRAAALRGRPEHFARELRVAGGNRDRVARGQDRRAVQAGIIGPERRPDRPGKPVERDVGEHAIPADRASRRRRRNRTRRGISPRSRRRGRRANRSSAKASVCGRVPWIH